MTVPMIWLAVYLAIGALVLLACSHTRTCRLAHRMERNRRISGILSFSGNPHGRLPRAPAKVPASR